MAAQLKTPDRAAPELHSILLRLAREARQESIGPERLLVIFKEVWNSLVDSVHPRTADQIERIRQDLVTICIKAYYAE